MAAVMDINTPPCDADDDDAAPVDAQPDVMVAWAAEAALRALRLAKENAARLDRIEADLLAAVRGQRAVGEAHAHALEGGE